MNTQACAVSSSNGTYLTALQNVPSTGCCRQILRVVVVGAAAEYDISSGGHHSEAVVQVSSMQVSGSTCQGIQLLSPISQHSAWIWCTFDFTEAASMLQLSRPATCQFPKGRATIQNGAELWGTCRHRKTLSNAQLPDISSTMVRLMCTANYIISRVEDLRS